MPEATTTDPMRYICYSYDVPKQHSTKLYPLLSATLQPFAVRLQQSVWVFPEPRLGQTAQVTERVREKGGLIDFFRYDLSEEEAIRAMARQRLEKEAARIQRYLEKSITETAKRLERAGAESSVDRTNAAIRYQQSALSKALRDITDAEECSVAFDLSGDINRLFQAVRLAVQARAEAFVQVRDAARSSAKVEAEADPAALGFGFGDDQDDQGAGAPPEAAEPNEDEIDAEDRAIDDASEDEES